MRGLRRGASGEHDRLRSTCTLLHSGDDLIHFRLARPSPLLVWTWKVPSATIELRIAIRFIKAPECLQKGVRRVGGVTTRSMPELFLKWCVNVPLRTSSVRPLAKPLNTWVFRSRPSGSVNATGLSCGYEYRFNSEGRAGWHWRAMDRRTKTAPSSCRKPSHEDSCGEANAALKSFAMYRRYLEGSGPRSCCACDDQG